MFGVVQLSVQASEGFNGVVQLSVQALEEFHGVLLVGLVMIYHYPCSRSTCKTGRREMSSHKSVESSELKHSVNTEGLITMPIRLAALWRIEPQWLLDWEPREIMENAYCMIRKSENTNGWAPDWDPDNMGIYLLTCVATDESSELGKDFHFEATRKHKQLNDDGSLES
ncbi:hypothetical protein SUGI_0823880 [Cryptomeria japonica]|nr:hypothetical protein SUGI_0823880 [Cryptomeria japonica]